MPPPLFGITPGLTILKTNLTKNSAGKMAIKHRRRHSRRSIKHHTLGRSKTGGRARKRSHRRRRRRRRQPQIPTHPALFT